MKIILIIAALSVALVVGTLAVGLLWAWLVKAPGGDRYWG